MEELPPTDIPPEPVDERPLIEKIGDKNWKSRLGAYEELKNLLCAEEKDESLFNEYGPWIEKMTADSNAGALDAGFDAALTFCEFAPAGKVEQYRSKLLSNSVDKAFSGKTATQSKGKSLILKLIEIDDGMAVTEYLLSRVGDKKPKIPPMCLEVIKEGLVAFGIKAFPVKEIIKSLTPIFNGTNSSAREAAMHLMVELYRWVKAAPLASLLDSIRSAQKTEFEKTIAEKEVELSKAPVPTVFLRKARPAPGSEARQNEEAPTKAGSAVVEAAGEVLDPREYVEEVDLMKKLKSTEYATLIANEKWSEQLKGLQLVVDALGPTPKLKPGSDVQDVIGVCRVFLRQGHVQLQTTSLSILGLLADGMRQEFSSSARPLAQPVILKVKEKKLVSEVQKTLRIFLEHCINFDSCCDDTLEILKNRKSPPHSKVCLLELLVDVINSFPTKISTDSLKPIAETLVSICEESDPKVRDGSSAALAVLHRLVRQRGKSASDANRILAALEQSAPRVFKKMQAASSAINPNTSVSDSTSSVAPASTSAVGSTTQFPSKRLSASGGLGSTATSSTAGPGSAKKLAVNKKPSGKAPKVDDEEPVDDLCMSPEQAEEMLAELEVPGWGTTFQAGMASVKWQDKVEVLSILERRLAESEEGGKYSAAVVKYLSANTSNFKITIINVTKAVLQTCTAAALHSGGSKFDKSAAWDLIRTFGDKLVDKKVKDTLEELLSALCKSISPAFVFARISSVVEKNRAPAAHQYFLEWLKTAILKFGCGSFNMNSISFFCKTEFENKAVGVRTAAVEVMGALYFQIGPRFQAIAMDKDMKPQIKTLLEAEFAKVGHDPNAAVVAAAASGSPGAAPVDTLVPRQDLSVLLSKGILSEINQTESKNSWQVRKAAMEAVISACERSGHFLEANKPTGEIVKALKGRVNDTQANLKPLAVTAIAHVIASLVPESGVKVLRNVAAALMTGLVDNKKPMRDSTVAALRIIVTLNKSSSADDAAQVPVETALLMTLLPPLGESLMNVVGRLDSLGWLLQHLPACQGDCSDLVIPLVATLQDKNAAVRANAEQVLMGLMGRALIPKITLDKATRDLPTAAKRPLQPAIDRMMSTYGSIKRQEEMDARKTPVKENDESAPAEEEEEPETDQPGTPNAGRLSTGKIGAVAARQRATAASVLAAQEVVASLESLTPVAKRVVVVNTPLSEAGVAPETPLEESPVQEPVEEETGGMEWQLLRMGVNAKNKRAEEFYRINWPSPPDFPGLAELQHVKALWESHITPELCELLFPSKKGLINQDTFIPGVAALSAQLDSPEFFQHTDLIMRWCCCVLGIRESSSGLLKLLDLIESLFRTLRATQSGVSLLHDAEVQSLLPHLIDKSGHNSERHRIAFKEALQAAGEVIAPNRWTHLLAQGLISHNKRSRVVCLEELYMIVELVGVASLGRTGVKDVGAFMESVGNDVAGRNAGLELIYMIYHSLGEDLPKLKKLLGPDLSAKTLSLIEDSVHQKKKRISFAPTASTDRRSSAASETPEEPVVADAITTPPLQPPVPVHLSSPVRISAELEGTKDTLGLSSKKLLREMEEEGDGAALITLATPRAKGSVEQIGAKTSLLLKGSPEDLQQTGRIEGPMKTPSKESRGPTALDSLMSPAVQELQTIYEDVVSKVDQFLEIEEMDEVGEGVYDEAKDYLKILHAIVNGEWSVEKRPEDEAVLLAHAETISNRLVKCISRGFEVGSPEDLKEDPQCDLDLSLLAISLSTLFAMVKRVEIANVLSETALFEIFYECLHRICDDRLQNSAVDAETKETVKQIVHALNMIVVRLAEKIESCSTLLYVLLRVLFCCIPATEVKHAAWAGALPATSTKPTSRLIIKVLTDEANKDTPYAGPEFNLSMLLQGIHQFFARHPANTADDTPFRTAKTILNEVIKALGGYQVISMLQQSEIPRNAFIYLLTSRLGGVPITEADPELHAKLVAVIDDITASRDKAGAIRELHQIKKANPHLDVNLYLHKISSAFRRFVLNTLAKLDEAEGNEENEVSTTNGAIPPVLVDSAALDSPGKKPESAELGDDFDMCDVYDHDSRETPSKRRATVGVPSSHKKKAPPLSEHGSAPRVRLVDTPGEPAVASPTARLTQRVELEDSPKAAGFQMTGPRRHTIIGVTSVPNVRKSSASMSRSNSNQGDEAMRILDEIRKRPSKFVTSKSHGLSGSSFGSNEEINKRMSSESSLGTDSMSKPSTPDAGSLPTNNLPFASRSDQIRNSLESLTASLSLPSTTVSTIGEEQT